MLKQRLLTALVLGALVVWGVLALPSAAFGTVLFLVLLIGADEWLGLVGLRSPAERASGFAVLAALIGAGALLPNSVGWGLVVLGAGFWVLALAWLARFACAPERRDGRTRWLVAGAVALAAPWCALYLLHRSPAWGPGYVLLLLVLVWAADSGAYFAGRRWGRTKLAPAISPGKTREGVYGALAAAAVVAVIGAWVLGVAPLRWLPFLLVCLATVLFSISGDLLESMLKRQHGAKDSGRLLPGHGGVLDRIDSLTAAAPVFVCGLWLGEVAR